MRAHWTLAAALLLSLSSSVASAETRTKLGSFKTTYYWVTSESKFSGPRSTPIYDMSGRRLGTFRAKFVKALTLEGTGVSLEGTTYNWVGRRYGSSRFKAVSHPYGIGSRNNPLVPFRSVATDPSVVPYGTVLYIPKAVGARLPDGTKHDGYFIAADTGGAINGRHLDLFTGLGDQRTVLTSNGVTNLRYHDVYKVTGGPDRPYLTDPSAAADDGDSGDDGNGLPPSTLPDRPTPPTTPTEPEPPTVTPESGQVQITASALNVRQGPGTDHRVIGSLSRNDRVKVTGRAPNGWYRIDYRGREGWISGKFAKAITAAPTETRQGKVTASALNVRSGPSTGHGKVDLVRRGQTLRVLETRDGWHRVELGAGRTGWVSGKYLTIRTVRSEGLGDALGG